MKKFLLISPKNRTVYNFRGDLISEIKNLGYEVTVIGPDYTDIDKLNKLGVEFVCVKMNKTGVNPLADLIYIFKLWRLMLKLKPDTTLGYTIKPVIYGSIASKLSGIRSINSMITGVGYLFTSQTRKAKLLKRLTLGLYKIGLSVSDRIIFQNRDDKEEFIENGLVKRDKTFVVNGSGVNMDKFSPSPLPQDITFFMLGRLLYSKGVIEYLKASELVKVRFPDVKFILLGKLEPSMQDGIKEHEIQHYIDKGIVELHGETNDVRAYYSSCSVFVLPSWREGTPRSVLEAMSMGRPIITTDTQGCRETVIDNVNGFLVPVKDHESLAERMLRFINNPSLIGSMGQKSLQLCKNKFDVKKVNREMLKIMDL